ncbi:MAG: Na+/H+ antiporter NhaC [Kordiimonadaceae bacterium]|jgi:Na+:H+ antiporter, NhaC family|nr:Na+/H+ antiporter NhaC [Kordiimonadaceae bacterium]MBT6032068.1 Na+/H+ antiporter NhaC [Kordiimonadaceae bacterium]
MNKSLDESADQHRPAIFVSILPIAVLIGLMTLNLFLDDAYVPSEMILFVSAVFAGLVAFFVIKVPYKKLEKGILRSIDMAMQANLIMLLVGALIAIWIASGIVPTLIYYGLEIISPKAFLTICCISCGIVAICTGSSWSTIGTVGLALIGVGTVMGINVGLVAGAIISGAYFGDKMSPVSDSTNLAPAMVGIDVITHIKHMVYTTGPAIILSLMIFTIIDIFYSPPTMDNSQIENLQNLIRSHFNISLWLLIGPIAVVVFVARGLPAMPALILGIFLAIVAVPIFQWDYLNSAIEGGITLSGSYSLILNIIASGFSIESGDVMIDQLFNRGGMSSMLMVVFLVLSAMSFGGIMEASGMLQSLAGAMISRVRSIGGLVAATLASCVFVNFTAANQSMAIIIPARMFASAYKKFDLHPKTLSRACEDAGTVTAPLIPWNTNAVFCTTALGVATIDYLPFVFFAYISPLVSLYLAYSDKTMTRIKQELETVLAE